VAQIPSPLTLADIQPLRYWLSTETVWRTEIGKTKYGVGLTNAALTALHQL